MPRTDYNFNAAACAGLVRLKDLLVSRGYDEAALLVEEVLGEKDTSFTMTVRGDGHQVEFWQREGTLELPAILRQIADQLERGEARRVS